MERRLAVGQEGILDWETAKKRSAIALNRIPDKKPLPLLQGAITTLLPAVYFPRKSGHSIKLFIYRLIVLQIPQEICNRERCGAVVGYKRL
ncbi:MAG: hypothetical protein ACLQU4_16885, partial [Limisphaerales bacterium]